MQACNRIGQNCNDSFGVVSVLAQTKDVASAAVFVTAVAGKKWFQLVSKLDRADL